MTAAVLSRPTLVLNRNWQPVAVSTVSRALVLVWNGSARVVDPSDFQQYDWPDWSKMLPQGKEPIIRTCRLQLRVPEVITLTTYDRMPTQQVAFSRRNLFQRDRYTCQYCGIQPGSEELTIDHVTPRSRGGLTTWENCVLACVECNKRKADRTPTEAVMHLRGTPKRPRWKPLYAARSVVPASWSQFISEMYWNVELEK